MESTNYIIPTNYFMGFILNTYIPSRILGLLHIQKLYVSVKYMYSKEIF